MVSRIYFLTFHIMKKLLATFGVLALAVTGCMHTDVEEDVEVDDTEDVVVEDVVEEEVVEEVVEEEMTEEEVTE